MKAKISEIFKSIQGEGKYLGVSQVFVRFYECNMNCRWCDTPTSMNEKSVVLEDLSVEEAFKQIKAVADNCHSISFTGGEPLLQKDFLKELLPLLKEEPQLIYLETNGILYEVLDGIIENVDIVSMDFKLPSSTGGQDYWVDHEAFLKKCLDKEVFVKIVVTSQTTQEDIEKAIAIIAQIDSGTMLVLQPETNEMRSGSLEKCQEYQTLCMEKLNDVRIIPQVHKFMEVR